MKVKLHDAKGLLVVPETEFETEVLTKMFPTQPSGSSHKAWVKSGQSSADVLGLVIEPVKKVEEKG
jgi:hypothetical protein